MSYEIKIYKEVLKSIQKLDKPTRNRILDHINILAEDPRHPELDIQKMQGIDNHFRLRVGSYRTICSIFDDQLIIVVIKVGSRGDIYKS
ncbi:type II toxin-antitoxin system RelE family toxin [Paenibacillus puerhi]|uniref:type II toxin-antitoxin system RelE family toxin n=1 Tax=Paenibacillus puerhi TaxID=2692622 RepID=UPI0013591B2C